MIAWMTSEASVLSVAVMAGIEPRFIFVLGMFRATSMPAAPMKILLSGIYLQKYQNNKLKCY